jgi:beta-lactamase regulating signal transducer with metallopeptidase domain
MSHPELFWSFAWKSALWFGAAYLVSPILRRRSASARHVFWTCVLTASLLLPVLIWFAAVVHSRASIPIRSLVAPPVFDAAVAIVNSAVVTPSAPPPLPWTTIWLAGVALLLNRLAIGHARLLWMFRNATPVRGLGVRTLTSSATDLPLTFGVVSGTVILPAQWDTWDAEARRSVLAHEIAHAERRDPLWNLLVHIATALHWFNPLAWLAMSAFRREQERSCDDAVLREGTDGTAYATQLVELARTTNPAISAALGVTDRFDLEGRVKALLDPVRPRGPMSARSTGMIAAAVLLLILPLGVIRAQAGMASITGTVADPSGAVVAGALIELKSPDGLLVTSAHADAVGAYSLRAIPPGSYLLEIGTPGFQVSRTSVRLDPGAVIQSNAMLRVGEISESIRIVGNADSRTLTRVPPGQGQRIRVGGNIQAPHLIARVDPLYPADAQAERVEGIVNYRAIISTSGMLVDITPVGTGDPRLVQAGANALRVWRYSPGLLNGVPTETVTTISLTFQLEK